MKYSKENLQEIVKNSTSISDVLRNLNLKFAGGTHSYIKRKIQYFNLDTSHFVRNGRTNRGVNHKGGPRKKNTRRSIGTWRQFSQRKNISSKKHEKYDKSFYGM